MASAARLSLGRSLVWFTGSYAIAILSYLALNGVAARFLGRADLGFFVVAVTAAAVAGQIGLLGVHRSGLREAARLEPTDRAGLGGLRGGVTAVSLLALPVVSLLGGGAAFALASGRSSGQQVSLAIAVSALVYLSGQQKLLAAFLRGLGHLRLSGMLEGRSGGALVSLTQAALLAGVWLLTPGWGLAGAVGAVAAGFLPAVLAAWFVLHRRWRGAPAPGGLLRNLRGVLARDWKFAVSQVGGNVNASLDLWLCGMFLSAGNTSLFAAGQRLAQLLLIPMTAMQVVFSPAIARLSRDGDLRRLETVVRTGSTLGTVVVGLAWLPLVLAPAFFLDLVFGGVFEAAAPVLLLLASAYLLNAVSGMSGVTLSMAHREGYVARVQWIAVALRVVLGSAAALAYGLVGLAVTSAAITVVFYLLMWSHARAKVGVFTHASLRPQIAVLRKVAG